MAQNTKWRSLIEVLEVYDLVDGKFNIYMFGPSTKYFNPKATGSLAILC